MLIVKKLLGKIVKSFVAQTSGDWTYFTIGQLFIGTYKKSITMTISTQVGNVYQSTNHTINLPFTISNNLYGSVVVGNSSYAVWSVITGSGSSAMTYNALSALSRTSTSYTVKCLVIGLR